MMAKKIGNFIFILFLHCFLIAKEEIHINFFDLNGKSIKFASMGVPFILDVSVKGFDENINNLEIKGIKNFILKQFDTSSYFNLINGTVVRGKDFKYLLKIDNCGKYEMGPAIIKYNGELYSSKISELNVKDELYQEDKSVFLRINTAKNSVFVGERVHFFIKFYFLGSNIKFQDIFIPPIPDFDCGKLEGPTFGREKIKGKEYKYLQWSLYIYPKKAGDLVIPSSKIFYNITNTNMSLFYRMLGFSGEQKNAFSNAVKLQVRPLPSNDKKIEQVGRFLDFEANIDRDSVNAGDAVILKLKLKGEGNLEKLELGKLNMPKELRYYDSSSYIQNITDEAPTKVFEFVVQGVEKGKWEIPEQEFLFFDCKDQKYKMLKTEPLIIEIMNFIVKEDLFKEVTEELKDDNASYDIKPIRLILNEKKIINWYWFFIILFINIFYLILILCKNFITFYKTKNSASIRKNKAFKLLKQKINYAQKNGKYDLLYTAFIEFFSDWYKVSKIKITQEFIDEKLIKIGCTEEQVNQWNSFFANIASYVFYKTGSYEDIFKESTNWLIIFKDLFSGK